MDATHWGWLEQAAAGDGAQLLHGPIQYCIGSIAAHRIAAAFNVQTSTNASPINPAIDARSSRSPNHVLKRKPAPLPRRASCWLLVLVLVLMKKEPTKESTKKPHSLGNCAALSVVPGAGIEPALLSEGDFESPASTNFTTRAVFVKTQIMAQ